MRSAVTKYESGEVELGELLSLATASEEIQERLSDSPNVQRLCSDINKLASEHISQVVSAMTIVRKLNDKEPVPRKEILAAKETLLKYQSFKNSYEEYIPLLNSKLNFPSREEAASLLLGEEGDASEYRRSILEAPATIKPAVYGAMLQTAMSKLDNGEADPKSLSSLTSAAHALALKFSVPLSTAKETLSKAQNAFDALYEPRVKAEELKEVTQQKEKLEEQFKKELQPYEDMDQLEEQLAHVKDVKIQIEALEKLEQSFSKLEPALETPQAKLEELNEVTQHKKELEERFKKGMQPHEDMGQLEAQLGRVKDLKMQIEAVEKEASALAKEISPFKTKLDETENGLAKAKGINQLREQLDEVYLRLLASDEQDTPQGQALRAALQSPKSPPIKPPRSLVFDQVPDLNIQLQTALSEGHESERKALIQGMAHDLRSQDTATMKAFDRREFVDQAWSKSPTTAPNIVTCSQNFNLTSQKIQYSILESKDREEVTKKINFYIDLLDACIQDKNYNSTMTILSALTSAPINRIINVPQLFPKEQQDKLQSAQELLSNNLNYKNYRAALKRDQEQQLQPIPYLGIALSAVTFMYDGNADELAGNVNLNKANLINKEISSVLQQVQSLSFDAKAQTHFLGGYSPSITTPNGTVSFDRSGSDVAEAAFARSLVLFPRKQNI